MRKPAVHLICNAHLDPVWQWRWEEGAGEALATFRTAADILEEHPKLVFCHNEAWLYQQVERLAPELFLKIGKLVRAGRWAVAGGWFLQPDTNLPGTESLVRQIVFGRRYFKSRFGKAPVAAYNLDSFGHSGGLPQLLRHAGFRMYIHMRPGPEELRLPSDLYVWEGVDGSRLLTYRLEVGLYHTERDNIEERLDAGVAKALELGRDVAVFWGLGDHGGGPTRRDLALIDQRMELEKRVHVIHSTPDSFYRAVARLEAELPVHRGDLQRVFTGCYTSLSRLKRRSRQSLGLLVQTEALRVAAAMTGEVGYPGKELEEAWAGHLFNDFHDIITGTCVAPAEQDALDLYGFIAERARRLRLEGLAGLCSGNRGEGRLNLTVFNTNPSLDRMPVEVEVMSDYRPFWKGDKALRLVNGGGSPVLSQEEPAGPLLPFHDWRRKLVFIDELPGVGLAGYCVEAVEADRTGSRSRGPGTDGLRLELDRKTGLVCKLEAGGGGQTLAGPLLEPVLIEDRADSWGTGTGAYRKIAARFKRLTGPVEVISGPVRKILRTVSASGADKVITDLCLYTGWPVLDIRLRVFASRARTRLKLRVPTVFDSESILTEVPGGALERPADGEEHVHGRWLFFTGRAYGRETGLGIVHSGCPGFDFSRGELRLSALRTSAYCHERGLDLDCRLEPEIADLGGHEIRVLVTAGKPDDVLAALPGLADFLDRPPFALASPLSAFGGSPDRIEFIRLSPPSVRLLALEMSPDGKAPLIRLQESIGRACAAELMLPAADGRFRLVFRPFELKTLLLVEGCLKETRLE